MTYRPLPVRLSRVVWGIASRAHIRQATFVFIALLAVAARCPGGDGGAAVDHGQAGRGAARAGRDPLARRPDGEGDRGLQRRDRPAGGDRARARAEQPRAGDREAQPVRRRSAGSATGCGRCTRHGEEDSTLAILLGSHSIGDFLDRIETVNSVAVPGLAGDRRDQEVQARRHRAGRAAEDSRTRGRSRSWPSARRRSSRSRPAWPSASSCSARSRARSRGSSARRRRRQARLAAEAQARLEAQLAAQHRPCEQAQQQDVVGASAVSPDGIVTVAPPSQYGGVVGIAMQYLGTPVRLGRLLTGRLRLLRAS